MADENQRKIFLNKVMDSVVGWVRFAEAKNAALLAFDIAVISGTSKWVDDFGKIIWIIIGGILISAIITLASFGPINHELEKAKTKNVNRDLMHFAYIASMTTEEYLKKLNEQYWKETENVDGRENNNYKITQEERDLVKEIVVNSRIIVRKQNLFKAALWVTCAALIVFVIRIGIYLIN